MPCSHSTRVIIPLPPRTQTASSRTDFFDARITNTPVLLERRSNGQAVNSFGVANALAGRAY